MIVGREVLVDDGVGLADVAHARARPEDEHVHDVGEGRVGRRERLLDAIHGHAGLGFKIVRHVGEDVLAAMGMVMVDRERRVAGQPQDLPALDLDGGA
jgi:hypothetical protein